MVNIDNIVDQLTSLVGLAYILGNIVVFVVQYIKQHLVLDDKKSFIYCIFGFILSFVFSLLVGKAYTQLDMINIIILGGCTWLSSIGLFDLYKDSKSAMFKGIKGINQIITEESVGKYE